MEYKINFNTTLGDFVASYPKARSVLEKFGLDYCCGGKKGLKDAALEKNININTLLSALEAEINNSEVDNEIQIWKNEPLTDIIGHILSKHHKFMWSQLPITDALLDKIVQVHGLKHGDFLNSLNSTYKSLKEALEEHLNDEEKILFPFVKELMMSVDGGQKMLNSDTYKEILEMLYSEHDDAGEALSKIRALTSNYALPDDACSSFESLYENLQAIENDLHEHVHLENTVLFPRIEELMDF